MKEVVSEEFHGISHLHEHFQVLIGRLGTCILVKRRDIMVHNKDHRLLLASLTGTERVRIACVDRLLFELLRPLLF